MVEHTATSMPAPVGTSRFLWVERQLARIRAENGRRVPCPTCRLMCLPETLGHHRRVAHDAGAATPRTGSGSRPDATPLPVSSKPAAVTAGALPHEPETSGE